MSPLPACVTEQLARVHHNESSVDLLRPQSVGRLLLNVAAVVSLLAGWAAHSAQATVITFNTNHVFSGTTPPAGSPPWLTATFDDTSGSVVFTLTAANLTGGEFISEFFINLDPSLSPAALSFSSPTKTGTFDDPGITKGTNAFQADGDGVYDVELAFETTGSGGGIHRFGAGDSVQYTITGIPTLTANSFNFDSAPGPSESNSGPFRTAAHIQGIVIPDGTTSDWAAPDPAEFGPSVPEPSSGILLIVGIAGLGALVRKRRT